MGRCWGIRCTTSIAATSLPGFRGWRTATEPWATLSSIPLPSPMVYTTSAGWSMTTPGAAMASGAGSSLCSTAGRISGVSGAGRPSVRGVQIVRDERIWLPLVRACGLSVKDATANASPQLHDLRRLILFLRASLIWTFACLKNPILGRCEER